MSSTNVNHAPVAQETAPLQRGRVDAYLTSKFLYARLFFAGVHDRCLFACAWVFDHPGDTVSIGSDAAIINSQCYRLAGWQREEVRRLDDAFAQGAAVTKRHYLALEGKREPRRRRGRE